jgi:hypothetical protein
VQNSENFQVKSRNKRKGIGVIKILLIILTVCIVGFIIFICCVILILQKDPKSKISRVKSDMRSMSIALEAYYTEHESYPVYTIEPEYSVNAFLGKKWDDEYFGIPTFRNYDEKSIHTLTTPVEYITGYLPDPFAPEKGVTFAYYSIRSGWIMWSPGPDRKYDMNIGSVKKYYDLAIAQPSIDLISRFSYDPTNGTFSEGDIFRVMW